jgi:uncharacterized protein
VSRKEAVYDVVEFKAVPSEDESRGKFEAIVSVFGNVDLVGDRVVKGAFTKSIEKYRETGDPIPVIWSHDWGNPHAHIGAASADSVMEVDRGLLVSGSLDLDNPFAAQVYRLMKERRVKEMSFAYNVIRERSAKDGANELVELDIIEVGPTLKGANPSTELLAVKSALEDAAAAEKAVQVKAGRVIAKSTESELIMFLKDALTTTLTEKVQEFVAQKNGANRGEGESEGEDEAGNGKSSTEDATLRLKAELEALLNA